MTSSREIKIVQVSASLDMKLGGPVTVVKGTNEYFSKKARLVNLVFGPLKIDLQHAHSIKTIANNRYGFVGKLTPKIFRDYLATADIVLIHGYYLFSTLLGIFHSKNARIFIMPHGSLENYQSAKGILRKRVFDYVVGKMLRHREMSFLVGSKSESDSIRNRFPSSKIFVVGLGVEEIRSQPKILHNRDKAIELLCMSRISEKKRIDLCIRAVSLLNSLGHKFSLKIYGSGDKKLEKKLRILAQELGVTQFVTFCGFASEEIRQKAYFDADLFLLPSENENFAVAVAESIYAIRPVVVSKYVAMHEFVDKYQVGKTILDLDANLLASAILDLIDNYDNYTFNCESHRELLSWKQVSKVWLNILLED